MSSLGPENHLDAPLSLFLPGLHRGSVRGDSASHVIEQPQGALFCSLVALCLTYALCHKNEAFYQGFPTRTLAVDRYSELPAFLFSSYHEFWVAGSQKYNVNTPKGTSLNEVHRLTLPIRILLFVGHMKLQCTGASRS